VLWPPEQSASHPRLTVWFLRTRISLIVWLLPLDLSGMGEPTSSYATAGIALRVSGALKPHHHDKVETLSVGNPSYKLLKSGLVRIGRYYDDSFIR
jgi:hypothetical protein